MSVRRFKYVAVRLIGLTSVLMLMAWFDAHAWADDYANMSLGMFNNARPSLATAKYGDIGHRTSLGLGFFNQVSGGGWIQTNVGDGRKSSGFIADQIGIEAENVVDIRVATGPALLTTPDSYLGGHFQFKDELFLGLKGTDGNVIGARYTHFSSAGLEVPNAGRDWLGIEVTLPF